MGSDPSTPKHTESTVDAADGVKLFVQSWFPAAPPRSSLLIVHGLKDHSSRYADFATRLSRIGCAVSAFDLRGHGRSGGPPVWINSFDEYLSDLDRVRSALRSSDGDRPAFLMGHSMGGAIVTRYVLERKPALRGMILSAPALRPGTQVSGFVVGLTKFVAAIAPHALVFKPRNENYSRDPATVAAMNQDPLIHQKGVPARTTAELLRTMELIRYGMEAVTVPILGLHGSKDRIADPEGSKELDRRARSPDKSLNVYDGLYHDLLHEPERATVTEDIVRWIEPRSS